MAEYSASIPHVDPVEITINQLFNKIIFCVNQRRVTVLTMYQDMKRDIISRPLVLARQEEELTGLRADIEERLQLNVHRELQEKVLAEIELKLAEVRTPRPDKRAVFRSQSVTVEQLITELGEVLEEEVPLVPNYQAMRPVVAVGKKGETPGDLYCPKGVAIDSNDHIFVVEGGDFKPHARISVFSERGDFLDCFIPQDMIEPYGIAIHGTNMYLTDTRADEIFQFKVETGFPFVAKHGIAGIQFGEFDNSRNLAVSNEGDIYIADCINKRVLVLNSSLTHFRYFTNRPINYPQDIKLTADEVYVLCIDSPCMHVFSRAGEELRSLVSRGESMQITKPLFFCLDSAENIIFSDNLTHNVKIFTKEGNLLKTLGEEGYQVGMLYFPRGLALTRGLSLVVVSYNKNFALQVFSL